MHNLQISRRYNRVFPAFFVEIDLKLSKGHLTFENIGNKNIMSKNRQEERAELRKNDASA